MREWIGPAVLAIARVLDAKDLTVLHLAVPSLSGPRAHQRSTPVDRLPVLALNPSVRRPGLSTIFPVAWCVFTLVRGEMVGFYPYPFIDVDTHGYASVFVNCMWIALLYMGVAAGARVLDRWLVPVGRVANPQAEPREAEGGLVAWPSRGRSSGGSWDERSRVRTTSG